MPPTKTQKPSGRPQDDQNSPDHRAFEHTVEIRGQRAPGSESDDQPQSSLRIRSQNLIRPASAPNPAERKYPQLFNGQMAQGRQRRTSRPNPYLSGEGGLSELEENPEDTIDYGTSELSEQEVQKTIPRRETYDAKLILDDEEKGYAEEEDDDDSPRPSIATMDPDDEDKDDENKRRKNRRRNRDRNPQDEDKNKDKENQNKKNQQKRLNKTFRNVAITTGVISVGVVTFGPAIAMHAINMAKTYTWDKANAISEPSMKKVINNQFLGLINNGILDLNPKTTKNLSKAGFEVVGDGNKIVGLTFEDDSKARVNLTKETLDAKPTLADGVLRTSYFTTNNPRTAKYFDSIKIKRNNVLGDAKNQDEVRENYDRLAYGEDRVRIDGIDGDTQEQIDEQREEILNGDEEGGDGGGRRRPGLLRDLVGRIDTVNPEAAGRAVADRVQGLSGLVTVIDTACAASGLYNAYRDTRQIRGRADSIAMYVQNSAALEAPLIQDDANYTASLLLAYLMFVQPQKEGPYAGEGSGTSMYGDYLLNQKIDFKAAQEFQAGMPPFPGIDQIQAAAQAVQDFDVAPFISLCGTAFEVIVGIIEGVATFFTGGVFRGFTAAAGVVAGYFFQMIFNVFIEGLIDRAFVTPDITAGSRRVMDFHYTGLKQTQAASMQANGIMALPNQAAVLSKFLATSNGYQATVAKTDPKSIWNVNNFESLPNKLLFAATPYMLSIAGNQGVSKLASLVTMPGTAVTGQIESLLTGKANAQATVADMQEEAEQCADPDFAELARDAVCAEVRAMDPAVADVPFEDARAYMLAGNHVAVGQDAPEPTVGGGSSGLNWKSGNWHSNSVTANAEAWGDWRGRPVDAFLTFTTRGGGWGPIENPQNVWNNTKGFEGLLSVSQPLWPQGQGNLGACASGAYNSHWATFGQSMVDANRADAVVRLGWEFNGGWFYWNGSNTQQWIQCFRNAVTAIRSTNPDAVIDWTMNGHGTPNAQCGGSAWNCYPGDEYVDIVGIDSYDHYPKVAPNNEGSWDNHCHAAGQGLCDVIDFAREHGKKFSVGEWGVVSCGSSYGGARGTYNPGVGDNPFYIEKMFETFSENSDILAYETYFDEPALGNVCSSLLSQNPNSAAAYKRLWGPESPGALNGGTAASPEVEGQFVQNPDYEQLGIYDTPASDAYKNWLELCTEPNSRTKSSNPDMVEQCVHNEEDGISMYDMFSRYTFGVSVNETLLQRITGERTATAAPRPFPGGKVELLGLSGKPWNSGSYGNTTGQSEAWANFRGSPLDSWTIFTTRGSWETVVNPQNIFNNMKGFKGHLVIAQPLWPEGQGNLAACASGAYNQQWARFGSSTAASDWPNVIARIGWEFNGNWFWWRASNTQQWVECFRQVASSIKSTNPAAIIDWSANSGTSAGMCGGDVYNCYPGDEYVDVISIDHYDMYDNRDWASMCAKPDRICGLANFAREHGKQFGVGEWGIVTCRAGASGGDHPSYVENMYAFFEENADIMAYENYFPDSGGGNVCSDLRNTAPQSRAAYQRLW